MLPPVLLCTALALALGFAPARARRPALVVLVLLAVVVSQVSFPAGTHEWIFAGCWLSTALTALTVHLRHPAAVWPAVLVAANTGVWAGAVTAISGTGLDLARALPAALLVFPAAWLVAQAGGRGGIAVKVVASWLVAVAILVAALPMVPTPGYVQDHME